MYENVKHIKAKISDSFLATICDWVRKKNDNMYISYPDGVLKIFSEQLQVLSPTGITITKRQKLGDTAGSSYTVLIAKNICLVRNCVQLLSHDEFKDPQQALESSCTVALPSSEMY